MFNNRKDDGTATRVIELPVYTVSHNMIIVGSSKISMVMNIKGLKLGCSTHTNWPGGVKYGKRVKNIARGEKYGRSTCHILHRHAFCVGCKIWHYTGNTGKSDLDISQLLQNLDRDLNMSWCTNTCSRFGSEFKTGQN